MEIRTLNVGRGINWIADGFGLFRMNPLIWIVILVIFLAIEAVLALIPVLGTAAITLLQPVLLAGLMGGCQDLAQGRELRIEHLFDGFQRNTKPLVTVGALILAAYFVIGVVGMILFFVFGGASAGFAALGQGGAGGPSAAFPALGAAIAALVSLALVIPVAMAAWFAPALVWFRDLAPLEALRQSFLGCWRNILPFLVYGLVALVLVGLAMIPFGLGLLIMGPTLVGSTYAAYLDIFPDGER